MNPRERNKHLILSVPPGYRVYQTLVGTWRWSKGVFGTPSWADGENLPDRNAAVRDAKRDAEEKATVKVA